MNFLKRFHWFELTLIVVVMSVHLYAAFSAPHNFSTRWFVRDDAYYYFKVAQNVSEGRGSTFDGINLTNGYHPLWMLMCVPIFSLARFDLILPLRILLVVMAALSVTTAILLFRLLKKPVGEPIAMLAAAYWALDMNIHSIITQQGMETGILALSVVILLYLMQSLDQKETLTSLDLIKLALAALLLLFSRLDSIYLVLLAGVWMVFRRTAIRWLLPVDLLLTLGIVVGAFIQRAGWKYYLLVYADSAVMMGAATFVLQTVVFYFAGLYIHPKQQTARELLLRTLAATALSTVLAAGIMLVLSAGARVDIPRAVPLVYGLLLLVSTLLTRFGARLVSLATEAGTSPENTVWAQIKTRFSGLSLWLRDVFVYFGIVGAGLLTYMGINKVLFGTWMPVSGQIKRWWGSLPFDVYGGGSKSVLDIYTFDPLNSQAWNLLTSPIVNWAQKTLATDQAFYTAYWSVIFLLIAAWLTLMLRNRPLNFPRIFQTGIIPLLISAELHGFLYGAMGYAAAHEWYWVMQMFALVILAALGLRGLLDLLPPAQIVKVAAWTLSGAASLMLVYAFASAIIDRMPYTDPLAGQPYMDMLPILEGYTEKGAIIGMTGGGNAGYFIHDRTVINMDGLINSYPYFQAVKAGTAGKYLAKIGMDYVFANYDIVTATTPYVEQYTPDEFTPVDGAPEYGRKELLKFTLKP